MPDPNFYTETIVHHQAYRSASVYRGLDLLEPVTRGKIQKIQSWAATAGITLQVLETYRSEELQRLYYARGVTQLQNVGVHHYGLACDLGIVVGGQVNWKASYTVLGGYAKAFGLVWGGDWAEPDKPHTFRDYDHVQRVAVADQAKLFDGSWYPDAAYVAPAVG